MSEAVLKTVALALFGAMYVCIIVFPKHRALPALTVAAAYVFLGILPWKQIPEAINWNALLMILGTMLLVGFFIESQMPNRIAEVLLGKAPNVMWAAIILSLFSGLISAFIDNVATVLMVAPVGIAVCRKLEIDPVGMIVSVAVSSNLQGAATLVGDTTSVMLASHAGMDFADFFRMDGRPGIFFAVEAGALATVPVMMALFRGDRRALPAQTRTEVRDRIPGAALLLMVGLLIAASFVPGKPEAANGLICMALALITAVAEAVRKKNIAVIPRAFKSADCETLGLLSALFCVIAGIDAIGLIDEFAERIVSIGGDNLFLLYTAVVWGSVLISAFVDNIPYVAAMLPVLSAVATQTGTEPCLLYFGLLSGATLGGNLTPIGASANITASGLLRKQGYRVSFGDFARIGIPFTLTAVTAGYILIWIFWN